MTATAPLPLHRFDAPAAWRSIEFISDLHLQADAPRTFEAWRTQLAGTRADAVFILGDLFEVWVGDDARYEGFERQCADVLREAAGRRWIGFMAGNRDFLLGADMAAACAIHLVPDATLLRAFDRPLLLTHGDALCLEDTDYQRFRTLVRSPDWQADFLSRPLAERRGIARAMRDASTAHQAQRAPALWADVDAAAALQLLHAAGCDTMVHGHTHRPGEVRLSPTAQRHVLSDWDLDGRVPRGDLLRLTATGLTRHPPIAIGAEG